MILFICDFDKKDVIPTLLQNGYEEKCSYFEKEILDNDLLTRRIRINKSGGVVSLLTNDPNDNSSYENSKIEVVGKYVTSIKSILTEGFFAVKRSANTITKPS